jgi:hypothetical protein
MTYAASVFYADRSIAANMTSTIRTYSDEHLPPLSAPAPRFQLRRIATGEVLSLATTAAPLQRSVLAPGRVVEPVDAAAMRERRKLARARRAALGNFAYDPDRDARSRARGVRARWAGK